MRSKTINLLEKNIVLTQHDLGLGNGFLDEPKIHQAVENKLDFIKKSFCASKNTIKKVKRHSPIPTKWEKIFADHIFGKRFVSRIYIELLKLNN